jgi:hypothetical protein
MKTLTTCLLSITLVALFSCNSSSEQKVDETKKAIPQPATNSSTNSSDSLKKTTIAVGPDEASVETKSGTQVKVNSQATSVGTKKVKISLAPRKN